jgi:hypothetical protein
MRLDLDRVRKNVASASTEDLLDRATVYREGMEPEVLEIIETELRKRGIGPEQIADHRQRRDAVVSRPDGSPAPCSFCHRPAIAQGWGWHRLWGWIPLFPRFFYYCEEHRPSP